MNSLRQKLTATPRPGAATEASPQRSSALGLQRAGDTFNPYMRAPTEQAASTKRDLRKLSEWIKMMRALEARKNSGQTD